MDCFAALAMTGLDLCRASLGEQYSVAPNHYYQLPGEIKFGIYLYRGFFWLGFLTRGMFYLELLVCRNNVCKQLGQSRLADDFFIQLAGTT